MAKNYFQQWTASYPTEFWHDSAEPAEIRRAAAWGAVGVTTNPILMPRTARSSAERWDAEIGALKRQRPALSAEQVAWAVMRGIAEEAAAILAPVYHRTAGHTGRVCVQVNPERSEDARAMVDQGRAIHGWAKNLLIKIPVTAAGLVAIEELAAVGVSTTATVSFTVPQVVQVAESFRRGLARARRAGLDTSSLRSYAVVMIGRLDDHLRDVAKAAGVTDLEPAIRIAGEAVAKKAARIYAERGYESILCFSSLRGYHDPGAVVGGPQTITVPTDVEEQVIRQGTPLAAGMDKPVPEELVELLLRRMPDFVRGYQEDGMAPAEYAGYGPVVKTLTQFVAGYRDMVAFAAERLAAV